VSDKLIAIVEAYFAALRDVYSLGAGTKERSFYPALAQLLNAIGQELKPKVLCLSDLGNTGAGHPDFGLFAASQVQKGVPRRGQVPERGVIEVKSMGDDAWLTADTQQVTKYFGAYRLVIVTNLRDFLIIGEDAGGLPTKLESFRIAPDLATFLTMIATPHKSAQPVADAFAEYLRRALTQSVSLTQPKDLAWFIASYARDALHRVNTAGNLPALDTVKAALEQSLGVSFTIEKGQRFFRSTLVQTLFYGVFSAWVLWAREVPRSTPLFDWRTAIWHLNVPFVRTLFEQLASPAHLQPLHLVEVLDWTAATLNRVDAGEFFSRFDDADAVQYFYEPFLEAFDPELRKELGVWYTPAEVVTYMVARVDKALREDLHVTDGLAADNVYILDPCCGTGAFLAAALRKIDERLSHRGYGALKGQMVKKAALERIFGFEIMPAPFVVSHLQVGLVLQSLGAALNTANDRAGIYLTNALTGWEPVATKPIPFPELEAERRRADTVKQTAPILVIMGNPPYNGYAGMAIDEERDLSNAYRTTKRVRPPEGQGLNDPYVRFFRMAERRIAGGKSGRGIICYISNYEWLHGLSYPGMRERFLEAFDVIRIDNLNGDSRETGKTTPDGLPDPSIFSTEQNKEGIRKGTAIATLIRHEAHVPTDRILYRDLWGTSKREELLKTAASDPASTYQECEPVLELGLTFDGATVDPGYFKWPSMAGLLPQSFSGVKTSHDEFLVDVDRDQLEARIQRYFDNTISDADFTKLHPEIMRVTKGYEPFGTRQTLRNFGQSHGHIVRYAYRPFDVRWLYWEHETKLLDRARPEYKQNVFVGNRWITTAKALRRGSGEPQYAVVTVLGSHHLIERASLLFPAYLDAAHGAGNEVMKVPNLSGEANEYLQGKGADVDTLFDHMTATVHAPAYRVANASGLAQGFPRVPLPADASFLRTSSKLGMRLAALLDPETPVPGVSIGSVRAGLVRLAEPYKRGGESIGHMDLSLTAGWGSTQIGGGGSSLVMPGIGMTTVRDYSPEERAALVLECEPAGLKEEELFALLGKRTLDVHLSFDVMWRNVPENVWTYNLGGYQVIKKWLSYRELSVLGRPLKPEEVAYVSEVVRRIASILLMGPALDANYAQAKANAVDWNHVDPAVTYELDLARNNEEDRQEVDVPF
jgi:hypothetical protein